MSRVPKALIDLSPRLRAAAEALASADRERFGYAPSSDHLGGLGHQPSAIDQYVSDARAALDAADATDRLASSQPRATGPLNAADAEALGRALGTGMLVLATLETSGRNHAAVWARGMPTAVLDLGEATVVFTAIAAALSLLPESPVTEEPNP